MKKLFWVFLVSVFLAFTNEGFSQTFTDDFESGNITRAWKEEGSTTSVSTKFKLDGKYSFRAYLQAKLYSNARSELRFEGGNDVPKHQDFFTIWGTTVAIYVPNDFQPDNTSREMIIQYHGMPDQHDTYKSPTVAVYLDGYELSTRIRYIKRDPGTPDDQETVEYYFGNITPGKWHFFVLDIRWDYRVNGDGFVKIYYKRQVLNKTYQPDFTCFEKVIDAIKAMDKLSGTEHAQIINYLKAAGLKLGLLINFGSESLEYKRFVYKS